MLVYIPFTVMVTIGAVSHGQEKRSSRCALQDRREWTLAMRKPQRGGIVDRPRRRRSGGGEWKR